MEKLPPRKLKTLKEYGVVWFGDLLLSERFVAGCEMRLRLGEYWGRILSGNGDPRDGRFASMNSTKIVAVLRTIWPLTGDARAQIGDGEFHSDRYNMLSDPNLNERDLTPLLTFILRSEHISLELTHVLMTRRRVDLRTALWNEFRDAQERHNFVSEVYSLASLDSTGAKIGVQLSTLASSRILTASQHEFVQQLLSIRALRSLRYSDIESVAYNPSDGDP